MPNKDELRDFPVEKQLELLLPTIKMLLTKIQINGGILTDNWLQFSRNPEEDEPFLRILSQSLFHLRIMCHYLFIWPIDDETFTLLFNDMASPIGKVYSVSTLLNEDEMSDNLSAEITQALHELSASVEELSAIREHLLEEQRNEVQSNPYRSMLKSLQHHIKPLLYKLENLVSLLSARKDMYFNDDNSRRAFDMLCKNVLVLQQHFNKHEQYIAVGVRIDREVLDSIMVDLLEPSTAIRNNVLLLETTRSDLVPETVNKPLNDLAILGGKLFELVDMYAS